MDIHTAMNKHSLIFNMLLVDFSSTGQFLYKKQDCVFTSSSNKLVLG